MWINQASTLQKFHKLHGKNVLMVDKEDDYPIVRIYFTDTNDLVSQMINKNALERGWKKK